MLVRAILIAVLLAAGQVHAKEECDTSHLVQDIDKDGEIVILDDDSIWEVEKEDSPDSTLWLPFTRIAICKGRLINTENGDSVRAHRIKQY